MFDGTIAQGVISLSDMRCSLIENPGTIFYLEPSEIHAVLAIGRAVFTISPFVHPGWFTAATVTASWIVKHACTVRDDVGKAPKSYTIEELTGIANYNTIAEEICIWWDYLEKNPETANYRKHKSFIMTLTNHLCSYWESLREEYWDDITSPLHNHDREIFVKIRNAGRTTHNRKSSR
jgi:hypothetical protein